METTCCVLQVQNESIVVVMIFKITKNDNNNFVVAASSPMFIPFCALFEKFFSGLDPLRRSYP